MSTQSDGPNAVEVATGGSPERDPTSRRELQLRASLRRAEMDIETLSDALDRAERNPVGAIRRRLLLWLLTTLSQASPPLPSRMAARFARSALKRRRGARGLVHAWPELDYDYALEAWERQRSEQSDEVAGRAEAVSASGPLISVLLAVPDPEPETLLGTLRSILAQSIGTWEMCVAHTPDQRAVIDGVLERMDLSSMRLRRAEGASSADRASLLNEALALASGNMTIRVDQGDRLDRDALLELAEALEADEATRLAYSDDDAIRADGRRHSPRFKPDWNRELLYGTDYIGTFALHYTDDLRSLGGFRTGFDGAENHDLLLRAADAIQGRRGRISHVARVLHSRPAQSDGHDARAERAGCRAVSEAMERGQRPASVAPGPTPFTYVPLPILSHGEPSVSIVIPTKDRLALTRATVEGILERTDYARFDITIVDNGSVERETIDWLRTVRSTPGISVLRDDGPFNFSRLNNEAVRESKGELVALLNNDVEVLDADWLTEMSYLASLPEAGCVGAKLLYPSGHIQHAGVVVGLGGLAGHWMKLLPGDHPGYTNRLSVRQEMTAVTGACLVVRRETYDEVGGLDEGLPVDFNDVDLCLKVRARGYVNLWTPFARLIHHESATRVGHDTPEKKAQFRRDSEHMMRVWGTDTFHDPAFNRNLSRATEELSLAMPPVW